jgi:Tfp pilus assembly protein PilZ
MRIDRGPVRRGILSLEIKDTSILIYCPLVLQVSVVGLDQDASEEVALGADIFIIVSEESP